MFVPRSDLPIQPRTDFICGNIYHMDVVNQAPDFTLGRLSTLLAIKVVDNARNGVVPALFGCAVRNVGISHEVTLPFGLQAIECLSRAEPRFDPMEHRKHAIGNMKCRALDRAITGISI